MQPTVTFMDLPTQSAGKLVATVLNTFGENDAMIVAQAFSILARLPQDGKADGSMLAARSELSPFIPATSRALDPAIPLPGGRQAPTRETWPLEARGGRPTEPLMRSLPAQRTSRGRVNQQVEQDDGTKQSPEGLRA